jgi:hypothetical protein
VSHIGKKHSIAASPYIITLCKRFNKQNRILSKAVSSETTDITILLLTHAQKTALKELPKS